jgi:3-deoxy-D-manno-octulosonic-acid transferase
MGRWLYSLCLYLALPGVLAFLGYRSLREPRYRSNLRQRFGHVRPDGERPIWIHAVSVGEVLAAVPLVSRLRAEFPQRPVLITTMTPTGADRVRDVFGDEVAHRFVPYDLPHMVGRFLARVQPSILIIMETEIWPNLVLASRRRGVPVILANARMSRDSAVGYRRIGRLMRPVFAAMDWIASQSEADAERFRQLGAGPGVVTATGSIKYDLAISDGARQAARALKAQIGENRPVWIAASTHDGEEAPVLKAHRRLLEQHSDALLILVPRHPERFEAVSRLITEQGFFAARRSRGDDPSGAEVYLADSMGELLMLFGCADVAFIGGSLIERGGHNPLEAAAWSLPVITGPCVFNFISIFEHLAYQEAVRFVSDCHQLADALLELLQESELRWHAGQRARAVVDANQGAVARLVEGIAVRSNG